MSRREPREGGHDGHDGSQDALDGRPGRLGRRSRAHRRPRHRWLRRWLLLVSAAPLWQNGTLRRSRERAVLLSSPVGASRVRGLRALTINAGRQGRGRPPGRRITSEGTVTSTRRLRRGSRIRSRDGGSRYGPPTWRARPPPTVPPVPTVRAIFKAGRPSQASRWRRSRTVRRYRGPVKTE